jgi:endonuclease/exonuclease/phosphatase family metal-dependent hydrolase
MDFLQAEALTSKKSEITYAAKTAVSDNDKISVMGYNIYGVNGTIYQLRADNICRKVTKYLPGIVSFQEPAKNLMDLIHMEQYYGYYLGIPRHTEDAPIVAGSVTIDGVVHQLNGANSYAPILYAKDRYEVVEGGTKWLTSTPDDYSRHPDSDYARIYTYVLFHDKTTDESFIVVNHHLDTNDDIQYETMKYMYKYFNENYTDIPVIMAGDMNANANSTVIKDLIQGEAGGFDSLQDMASPRVGNAMAPLDVDWIFATPCCVTGVYFTMCRDVYPDHSDARFDNGMPSDHPAAYAEMIIDSKKRCHHDWTEAASGVSWAE